LGYVGGWHQDTEW